MNEQTETKTYPPELAALLQRSLAGDAGCLPELRQALDAYPELVDKFGDLTQHVQCALISIASPNLLGKEAIGRKAAQVRSELLATAMTPVEKLLADRVAVSWADVHSCDLELAHRRKVEPADAPTLRAAERRLNGAQARHLAALKALATTQKLLRPALSALELFGGSPKRSSKMGNRRASFNPANDGASVAN